MERFERLCILGLDNVDRHCDIMKASDLCQNNHIMTGDANWDFYYNFTDEELEGLRKLGADIDCLFDVELYEFSNPKELNEFILRHENVIDTDGYFVLTQGAKK